MKQRLFLCCALSIVLSYGYSQEFFQDLDNRIDAYQDSVYVNDSILANMKVSNKELAGILRENNRMKDSVIVLLNRKCLNNEKTIADYSYELELIDFYWCTDTTVFGSQYIVLNKVSEYPQYLIEFYQLVTDLRKINLMLVDVEKVIDDINKGETTATLTPELKGKIILERTEEKLREAMELLVRFEERELHPYLSPEQISYYQDYLKSKYNGILDIIENK